MKDPNEPVASIMDMNEEVNNLKKHQLANATYFPCYINTKDNTVTPALFTERELRVAMERAEKNPEDIDAQYQEEKTWLESIFG